MPGARLRACASMLPRQKGFKRMEINELHARIVGMVTAAEDLTDAGLTPTDGTGNHERLAALVRLLDESLRAGGRLPDAWVLRKGGKTDVSEPERLEDAPNGARLYRITVSGFEVPRHRILASAAIRSFARTSGLGRVSLKESGGTFENDHGTSEFTYSIGG